MAEGLRVRLTPLGDWRKIDGFERLAQEQAQGALARATHRGALLFQENLKIAYLFGRPEHAVLHPFTVEQKGGSQPLYASGALAQSVELVVIDRGPHFEYAIGFKAGEQAMKARIAEDGGVWTVTDAMRGFLASQGLHLNPATKFLHVPPRPVIRPVTDETLPHIRRIVENEIQRELQAIERSKPGLFARLWRRISG